MPADGEGRNGVLAAELGWEVTCFDLSSEGRSKALQLAEERGVALSYIVVDFEQLEFEQESFDAIGLIYAHFPAGMKSAFHQKLNGYLKPGGLIIFEAFSKQHLHFNKIDPRVGGPKDIDELFSKEEIMHDFNYYEVSLIEEEEIVLSEGIYHVGIHALPCLRFEEQTGKPMPISFPKNPVSIGVHIRKKRMELKLPQNDLAKICEVSEDCITNWKKTGIRLKFNIILVCVIFWDVYHSMLI